MVPADARSTHRPPTARPEEATRTVTLDDDRTVAYTEYGSTDGKPVVFLHGTPGSRLLGGLFDDAARRTGVRLLAPDRPGFGRSSPWPDRTLADTGSFLAPLLDDAGVQRAAVAGFSGGGPYALAFAATHGERVVAVDLVASATPPTLETNTPAPRRLLATMAARTPRLLGGLFRCQSWVARRTTPETVVAQYTTDEGRARLDDDVTNHVREDFLEALTRHRSGTVTELRVLAERWDVSPDDVDHHVRVWHGNRDTNVPIAAARRLSERPPNATFRSVTDADHLTTLLRTGPRLFERAARTPRE